MTTVTFHMEGERIVGFTVQGHSGYADEGSDIICAAVTSAVRLTECAVNDVLGLGASVKVRESDALLVGEELKTDVQHGVTPPNLCVKNVAVTEVIPPPSR